MHSIDMAKPKRHISEIVAEVILILVTLSVGALVLSYVYSQTSQVMSKRVNAQDYLGYVVPITDGTVTTGKGDYIYIIVNTGPLGAELEEVMSSAGPLTCNYTAITSGNQLLNGSSLPFNAPADAIVTIWCSSPGPIDSVTLVTNVGEVTMGAS